MKETPSTLNSKVFQLRPYQIKLSKKGYKILSKLNIVYLCMEVRTGKTLTSLEISRLYGAKNVLFLTKKKGIKSIEEDYKNFGYKFKLTVINDESLHLIEDDSFDLIIRDEHHRSGSYPKMGKFTKMIKENYSHLPMIFLSGTPHAEGYSQIFHQFHVSDSSPFSQYKNFYRWCDDYVEVTQINLGYAIVNDYSKANYEMIRKATDPYFIRFTQKKAGFSTKVNETVLYCKMKDITYELCNRLKRDRVIDGEEVILADTAVKLQQKLHQMYSGTVKFESGSSFMFDNSKAIFIKKKFKGQRIGVFYKFVEELNALKSVFTLTQDVETFNSYEFDVIALQFLSGREAISLKTADSLVYFNIDFSAITYFQSKDRMATKERKENDVYWIFSRGGIEEKIYKTVCEKKDYTVKAFKKDYGF